MEHLKIFTITAESFLSDCTYTVIAYTLEDVKTLLTDVDWNSERTKIEQSDIKPGIINQVYYNW